MKIEYLLNRFALSFLFIPLSITWSSLRAVGLPSGPEAGPVVDPVSFAGVRVTWLYRGINRIQVSGVRFQVSAKANPECCLA
ncbi:hypothetical protein D1AOALGA4SA_3376 [Olavius algarvensis Delta 1 endosymbiont]|nr:hypothetical protein D1AOALGA4SA_3376 [Olavius algarvensis Delta 1 endosymbiont]